MIGKLRIDNTPTSMMISASTHAKIGLSIKYFDMVYSDLALVFAATGALFASSVIAS
ncbi:hypothetical protein D3C84_1258440 [compost metagenome]